MSESPVPSKHPNSNPKSPRRARQHAPPSQKPVETHPRGRKRVNKYYELITVNGKPVHWIQPEDLDDGVLEVPAGSIENPVTVHKVTKITTDSAKRRNEKLAHQPKPRHHESPTLARSENRPNRPEPPAKKYKRVYVQSVSLPDSAEITSAPVTKRSLKVMDHP
jgi:hypothetical protein